MKLGLFMRNGNVRSAGATQTVGWAKLREIARTAEAVGFDTIWIEDHFIFRNSPPIVMAEGESHGRWDTWVILSALAEATSRVTLGPFVACTGFRNPALLAKMADTLDEVSGGRLILALGAGWHRPEYDAFGYPFDHRVSRFEEAIQIIMPLLREGRVDFQGQYHTVRDCELLPRGPRPNGPPIWIGAKEPRMLGLTARYADAFNSVWHPTPQTAVAQFDKFKQICAEVGRDPSSVGYTAGTFVVLPDEGATTGGERQDVISGSTEEIATRLYAFQLAGVEHLTFTLDPWEVRTIERFGAVIDALRRLQG